MRHGKTAAILYGEPDANAAADEEDTLAQARTVGAALRGLGWDVLDLPVSLDLASVAATLKAESPRFVFNLVESLGGKGRLIAVVPGLLDSLGIPFTGAGTDAVFLTSNKPLAKTIFHLAGIPTPPSMTASEIQSGSIPDFGPPFIVKDVWEHASIGLDDEAVASSLPALLSALTRRAEAGAVDAYVEPFVDGREFNLALLCGSGGEPQSLPPAEIQFIGYPEGKPRVVGYKAKWMEDSFEFKNTPRRFDFPASDAPLIEELAGISRSCWRLFNLRGYARVDFRVDASERPFVLEINTNPCIAPDSGFVAAASRAGLGIKDIVERIVVGTLGKERV